MFRYLLGLFLAIGLIVLVEKAHADGQAVTVCDQSGCRTVLVYDNGWGLPPIVYDYSNRR